MERPSTTLEPRALKEYAGTVDFDDEFPPSKVHIIVDANASQSIVLSVVHELLHVVLSEVFIGRVDETLEEVMIVGLEAHIFRYISERKARLARWSALIDKKLAEHSDTLPAIPIEKLVDRT